MRGEGREGLRVGEGGARACAHAHVRPRVKHPWRASGGAGSSHARTAFAPRRSSAANETPSGPRSPGRARHRVRLTSRKRHRGHKKKFFKSRYLHNIFTVCPPKTVSSRYLHSEPAQPYIQNIFTTMKSRSPAPPPRSGIRPLNSRDFVIGSSAVGFPADLYCVRAAQ